MSTNTNPDAASASSARDNPCYGGDPNVASLNVFADDEHSYLLPYAQLLYAEMISQSGTGNQRMPLHLPEKLVICFCRGRSHGVGLRPPSSSRWKYSRSVT